MLSEQLERLNFSFDKPSVKSLQTDYVNKVLLFPSGKAGVSEAVVMGITAAIVCVALAGVAVFCGMKRLGDLLVFFLQ